MNAEKSVPAKYHLEPARKGTSRTEDNFSPQNGSEESEVCVEILKPH